jgi:hypothetical protein
MMGKHYQNDQWTIEDGLGIAGAGDTLARMALEVTPSFSIRVTGKWGAGKTSVLKRAFATLGGQPIQQSLPFGVDIKEFITKDWESLNFDKRDNELNWKQDKLDIIAEKTLCIWFSPWQHQVEVNPLIALLLELKAQFSTYINIKDRFNDFNRRGGLATATLIEGFIEAVTNLKIKGTTEAVQKAYNNAAPKLTELSNGQRFHLLFDDVVNNVLYSIKGVTKETIKNARLIIFIDDLDRCEESVIVNLLEAIKLYLSSPNCIFIFGIDETAVIGAMKRHWGEGRSEVNNREYLEKMFQATILVPLPKQENLKIIIKNQLKLHKFTDIEVSADIIERLIEPNPRKVKNFCNSLCAAWGMMRGSEETDAKFALRFILFNYLRLFHQPIWRILERQPYALSLLMRVLFTGTQDKLQEREDFKESDQKILRELFFREFSHVLGDESIDILHHKSLTTDQAVTLMYERQDRKRSDEFFIYKLREFENDDILDDRFLYNR